MQKILTPSSIILATLRLYYSPGVAISMVHENMVQARHALIRSACADRCDHTYTPT